MDAVRHRDAADGSRRGTGDENHEVPDAFALPKAAGVEVLQMAIASTFTGGIPGWDGDSSGSSVRWSTTRAMADYNASA